MININELLKQHTIKILKEEGVEHYEEVAKAYAEADVNDRLKSFLKEYTEILLKEVADRAKVKEIYEPSCDDHTPYRGECGKCGSYHVHDVLVGSIIDKESITSIVNNINFE